MNCGEKFKNAIKVKKIMDKITKILANYIQIPIPLEFPVLLNLSQNLEYDEEHKHINIESLYIPGHAKLELKSLTRSVTIMGPAWIPKMSAYLLFWENNDQRVLMQDVISLKVKRHIPWITYLYNISNSNQDLQDFKIDKDALFTEICQPKYDLNCNCFNTFIRSSQEHPGTTIYPNLLNSSCNPNQQYMHSLAHIGIEPEKQCTEMLHSMLTKKTLSSFEQKGPEFFECGNKRYSNVLITDRTKRFDDETDKAIEIQQMQYLNFPFYFIYILFTFIILILGLLLSFVCRRSNDKRKSSKNFKVN